MFTAQLIHDPESAVAKTLDQSILKLNAMMKNGNADTRWSHNITNSAKDLDEKYHHDFIRYLANPGGFTQEGNSNQQLEDMISKSLPDDAKAFIPEDLEQRYTSVQQGDNFNILVENISLNDEEDEKNP
jgi:hypothetical protein